MVVKKRKTMAACESYHHENIQLMSLTDGTIMNLHILQEE